MFTEGVMSPTLIIDTYNIVLTSDGSEAGSRVQVDLEIVQISMAPAILARRVNVLLQNIFRSEMIDSDLPLAVSHFRNFGPNTNGRCRR